MKDECIIRVKFFKRNRKYQIGTDLKRLIKTQPELAYKLFALHYHSHRCKISLASSGLRCRLPLRALASQQVQSLCDLSDLILQVADLLRARFVFSQLFTHLSQFFDLSL